MSHNLYASHSRRKLFSRYWKSASGYWRGANFWKGWLLILLMITTVLLQLLVAYLINFWNRDFFNALNQNNVALLWGKARAFVPLAITSIALAILAVWTKMTVQRGWREWLSKHLIHYWLENGNYRRLQVMKGKQLNAEYRIAEDARVATDTPIDLALGLLSSILTAAAFISVLWTVGGSLDLTFFGATLFIPGYLVISAVAYSLLITGSMILIGRHLTHVVEIKNHFEAEFRSAGSKLREHGEEKTSSEREVEESLAVEAMLDQVILWWRNLCWQLMQTTCIAHGNPLIAPIIGLLLCTPKYLSGDMSLGEVVQASAAFVTVQSSFNWLMDNYPRIADWLSSANRVAFLLLALDELKEE